MATALPVRSCAVDRKNVAVMPFVLADAGDRLLRQGSDALAQAINVSLTAVALIADLALAASLAATAAGLVG